jgi:hypothetical protein
MKESTSKAPSGRPQRKRVTSRNRLDIINKDPDKVYRLIDNDPARIYQFQQMGYEIQDVKQHLPGAERVDAALIADNSIPVGGGKRQVLVAINKDWYEEDQREKQKSVDESEAALKPKTSDGFYGDIKITR